MIDQGQFLKQVRERAQVNFFIFDYIYLSWNSSLMLMRENVAKNMTTVVMSVKFKSDIGRLKKVLNFRY